MGTQKRRIFHFVSKGKGCDLPQKTDLGLFGRHPSELLMQSWVVTWEAGGRPEACTAVAPRLCRTQGETVVCLPLEKQEPERYGILLVQKHFEKQ